jgi:cystathionine beta-lyase/cystathionine gamma-synthase
MSHASVPAPLRHVAMPPRDLVRLSIGLEDFADLAEDLDQALGALAAALCPPPAAALPARA